MSELAIGSQFENKEGEISKSKPSSEQVLKLLELESVDNSSLAVDFYLDDFSNMADGPQIEGLGPEEIANARNDKRSIFVKIQTGDTELDLPILTPVEYTTWYNKNFFEDNQNIFSEDVYHFTASPNTINLIDEEQLRQVALKIQELANYGATIVFDEQSGNTITQDNLHSLLNKFDIEYEEIFLGDETGGHSQEIHFAGRSSLNIENKELGKYSGLSINDAFIAMVENGEFSESSGTKLLHGADLTEEKLDELWSIYQEPFKKLIKDDPLRMMLNRDEFDHSLSDPNSINIIHEKDGKIVTFMQLVQNLQTCTWLNMNYYENKFPDAYHNGHLWYFPGIVTDINNKGEYHSHKLIKLMSKLCSATNIEPTIVFECSEISSKYIPLIVERSTNQSGYAAIKIDEISRYNYRALKLSNPTT